MTDGPEWLDHVPPEIRAYAEAETRYRVEEHQLTMRFAPMLCRCAPWYDHEDPGPPQVDCYVHTTIVINSHTGELLL